MLSEIKVISEKKRKEDDVILAIAAGNTRPVISNLDYEFSDPDIHEDLYQLIKYSCAEVCTSEQLEKVMKIWTTFLEPMFGVPSRPEDVEDTEDVEKSNTHAAKSTAANLGETDCRAGDRATISDPSQSDNLRNADEHNAQHSRSSRVWLQNDENVVRENGSEEPNNLSCKNSGQRIAAMNCETFDCSKDSNPKERFNFNASLACGVKDNNGSANLANASGSQINSLLICF